MTPVHPPLVGSQYIGFDGARDEKEVEARTRAMLFRSLNIGNVIGFIGSGVSRAYGRPSWSEFTSSIIDETLREQSLHLDGGARACLEDYGSDAGNPSRLSTVDRTLLVLGICDAAWRAAGRADVLRRFMAHRVGSVGPPRSPAEDPLSILMEELRVTRFLTINYDLQIEDAFARVFSAPVGPSSQRAWGQDPSSPDRRDPAVQPKALSLSVNPTEGEELVQFAVGSPPYGRGVFHCHGDVRNAESMIVTERDYQRLYLSEQPQQRYYRRALDVAFNSNSILFVGVGLEEGDLLRPLREFVSEQPGGARERPLFALVGSSAPDRERVEFRRYLLARYGVKVLHHDVTDGNHTPALCAELKRLVDEWAGWWMGWQGKPPLRRPEFSKRGPGTMIHHRMSLPDVLLDSRKDEEQVTSQLGQGKAVLVLARSGAGKGSMGQRLVSGDVRLPVSYAKKFFATTHFTNEYLSILEAAAAFLGGDVPNVPSRPGPRPSPQSKLRDALQGGRHLLVISGLERLLVRGDFQAPAPPRTVGGDEDHPLPLGMPISEEVRSWISDLADTLKACPGKSDVVLMTSIYPATIDLEGFALVRLRGIEFPDLRLRSGYQRVEESVLRNLHYALRGHLYAMAVIAHALDCLPDRERERWLTRLTARLMSIELVRRAEESVNWAIRVIFQQNGASAGFLESVLQTLSIFSTPVGLTAIAAALKEPPEGQARIDHALQTLVRNDLIMMVDPSPGDTDPRYTAHTVVRTRTLHQLGAFADVPGEPQRLILAGFSSEGEEPAVATGGHHTSVSVRADAILERLEQEGEEGLNPSTRRGLIRGAFSLLRAQFAATGIGRRVYADDFDPRATERSLYEEYLRRLARVLNAVRRQAAGKLWLFEDREDRDRIIDSGASLYADELAWLYNELGLVSYCQGTLADAYSLFRVGQDVNIAAEGGNFGHRWCQSEMNLALVQIDRGRLRRAEYHLYNVLRAETLLEDDDLKARAHGYVGLVRHLSGDYAAAHRLYEKAVGILAPTGNYRGASIFRRHWSDVLRRHGDFARAREEIHLAIGAAEAGGHPDLMHFCRVADANLRLAKGKAPSQESLAATVDFARSVGIPRLMADAFKIQGHLALAHGETELAGRLAISQLALANENGMRLRVTAGLAFLGRVECQRGRVDAARSLFRSVTRAGLRQGYQIQVEDAERELLKMQQS